MSSRARLADVLDASQPEIEPEMDGFPVSAVLTLIAIAVALAIAALFRRTLPALGSAIVVDVAKLKLNPALTPLVPFVPFVPLVPVAPRSPA